MLIRNLNLAKAGKYFDSNGSLNLVAGSNITVDDDLAGNITISSTASGTIDSAAVLSLIDSSYVQARQTPQDFAYSSLTGTPNVLDSTNVNTLITSAVNSLVDGAPGALNTLNELAAALDNDSNFAGTVTTSLASKLNISDFDSSFDARLALKSTDDLSEGTNEYYTDAKVEALVDSAYVQLRQTPQDFAYSSLTGTPNVLDSANVSSIILFDVDSAYVQLRQTPQDFAYSSLTGAPTNVSSFTNDAGYLTDALDSTEVTAIVTSTIDSTYVNNLPLDADTFNGQNPSYYLNYQNHTNTPNVLDSVNVSNIILSDVDSAYVQLRQVEQDFAYSSLTGAPNVLDSADVSSIILSDVDSAYVQLRQTQQDFAYSSLTGTPNVLDSADVTIVAKAAITAGTGISITDGVVSIGQSVGTEDSVTFDTITTTGDVVVGGNLQVNGTTTTVDAQSLEVSDNMIYMNAGESSGSPTAFIDVGWAANVNDQGSYYHVGLFRDATDQTFKVYHQYVPEPDSSVQIDTGHASFTLAPFAASTLTGEYLGFDSDFGLKTTDNLTQGSTNKYYSDTLVQTLVDSGYVQLRQTPQDFAYSSLTGTPNVLDSTDVLALVAIGSADSATILGLVDSAYVQARQDFAYSNLTGTPNILDSATILGLVDSAHVQSLQTPQDFAYSSLTGAPTNVSSFTNDANYLDSNTVTGVIDATYINSLVTATDSAAVINIVTSTVDSAYVQARQIAQDFAYSSLTGTPNILDSANISNIIIADVDATFINALTIDADTLGNHDSSYYLDYTNFTNTPNVLDSSNVNSLVTAAINALVNGAPAALDTLGEIATQLGNDSDAIAGIVNTLALKFNTSDFNTTFDTRLSGKSTTDLSEGTNLYYTDARVETHVDSAYVQLRQDYAYSSLIGAPAVPSFAFTTINVIGQTNVIADSTADTLTFTAGTGITITTDGGNDEIVISANGVDSNATIALITSTVDSAYVQLLQSYVGEVGIDSATAIAISRALVDSAITENTGITLNTWTGDASTTTFNTGYTTNVGAADVIVAVDGIIQRPTTDYDIVSGNVVFTTAPDSDVTVSSRLVAGAGNHNWITVTNTSAANGNRLFIDCSSSAVTIQLPPSPNYGDEIYIVDAEANAATNNITINRNGQNIDGVAEDLVVDVDGAAFILAYYNATRGWIFIGR